MAKVEKHGYMNCEGCAADGKTTRVLVRKTPGGALSASCDECDVTEYAPAGTAKLARWLRRLTPINAPAPELKVKNALANPEPKPKPEAKPKPEDKPRGSFGLR